ncbi:hypothetical protein [Nocardioides sambongensis]|nr:hypothetical protein [Nocardioides sambongensis]
MTELAVHQVVELLLALQGDVRGWVDDQLHRLADLAGIAAAVGDRLGWE